MASPRTVNRLHLAPPIPSASGPSLHRQARPAESSSRGQQCWKCEIASRRPENCTPINDQGACEERSKNDTIFEIIEHRIDSDLKIKTISKMNRSQVSFYHRRYVGVWKKRNWRIRKLFVQSHRLFHRLLLGNTWNQKPRSMNAYHHVSFASPRISKSQLSLKLKIKIHIFSSHQVQRRSVWYRHKTQDSDKKKKKKKKLKRNYKKKTNRRRIQDTSAEWDSPWIFASESIFLHARAKDSRMQMTKTIIDFNHNLRLSLRILQSNGAVPSRSCSLRVRF